jgi:hypothetical protein
MNSIIESILIDKKARSEVKIELIALNESFVAWE